VWEGSYLALQERAIITRMAIIEGAAAVFAGSGYGSASMSDVAQRSGVTKGALYFHFKSKEELAAALIEAQHAVSVKGVEAILAEGYPALETMVRSTGSFAGLLLRDPVVQAGIRLTFDGPSLGLDVRKPYQDWVVSMGNLIHRGVGEGQIRSGVDAPELARLIVGAFTGIQLVSEVLSGRQDLPGRVESLWEFLLPAVVTPENVALSHELPPLVRNYM
jgi:AcrR family transcriptional regulator